jgi:short-subunit dehydrogenase
MQQRIRNYAPDEMDGNGTSETNELVNDSTNSTITGTGELGAENLDAGNIGLIDAGTGDTGTIIGLFPEVGGALDGDMTDAPQTTSDADTGDGDVLATGDINLGDTNGENTASAGITNPGTIETESGQSSLSEGNRANGKTALITGASSGIGRELANQFSKEGYNLILVARSEDSLQQIAEDYKQQFGIQATVISRDLADASSPNEIYAETKAQGLQVDVLVNNAGIGEYGKFGTESNLEKELDLIQINSVSLVHLTKLFLNDMIARNEGKILILGSVASVMPHPMMAIYGATKSFNYSFGESLRNELKDTNITVTVLMPPPTDTDFFNKAGASHTVAQEQAYSMTPAEVAKAGYEALMAGKDKVAPGLSAKLQVASGFLLPDAVNAQNIRNLMKDRNEAKQEKKLTMTVALLAGAALLGGWWALSRNRNNGVMHAYDRAKYKAKTGLAKQSIKSTVGSPLAEGPIDSLANSLKESIYKVRTATEDIIA